MSAVFEEAPVYAGAVVTTWPTRLKMAIDNPGREVRLADHVALSTVTNLKRRTLKVPAGRWTFRGRTVNAEGVKAPPGRTWLYATYHGDDEVSA